MALSLAPIATVGLPIAFLAGLASFVSPCLLPILPGYLAYMSGRSASPAQATKTRASARVLPAVAFVLGFTAVFVALGLSASVLGRFLVTNKILITRLAGGFIIMMGLVYLGVIPFPWLYSEHRLEAKPGEGLGGTFAVGLAFGFGWTPCVGTTLGAVLAIAAAGRDPARGASLLLAYSMGLGVPFVVSALGMSHLVGAVAWLRRRQKAIMRVSGAMLVGIGLLFMFNRVFWLASLISKVMGGLKLNFWSRI